MEAYITFFPFSPSWPLLKLGCSPNTEPHQHPHHLTSQPNNVWNVFASSVPPPILSLSDIPPNGLQDKKSQPAKPAPAPHLVIRLHNDLPLNALYPVSRQGSKLLEERFRHGAVQSRKRSTFPWCTVSTSVLRRAQPQPLRVSAPSMGLCRGGVRSGRTYRRTTC